MSAISFYEPDGEINAVLEGDESVIELTKQMTASFWIEGFWDGKLYYVVDGTATLRPDCPAVLDGLTLTNLPVPCVLEINGTQYNANQTEVELDLVQGLFIIKIIAFPYLDGVFNVEN
jgi:hypothetical protein